MSDLDPDEASRAPAPNTPFIRHFSAPAGAPWDQARAARLEAAHGAPLPVDQLEIVLHRLDRWRPGAQATYAAAYFRRDGIGEEQRHVELVGGEAIEFVARGEGAKQRAQRFRLMDLSLVVGATLTLLLAGSQALGRRADLDAQLREADTAGQRALQAGREARRRQADALALTAAGAKGALLSDALADLVWLSRARRPEATVEQIDWSAGELRIVARGSASPIATADRLVLPSDETRPAGTSLWRVPSAQYGSGRAP